MFACRSSSRAAASARPLALGRLAARLLGQASASAAARRPLSTGDLRSAVPTSVFGSNLEPALRHLIAAGCVQDKAPLRGNKTPVKCATAEEALEIVSSGERVFVHCGANTPNALLWGLYNGHRHRLSGVEFVHILINGETPYSQPDFANSFNVANLFCGSNVRALIDYDKYDYVPTFMSDCPHSVSEDRPASVALLQVSTPDQNGWCSMGPSPALAMTAAAAAKKIVAMVNPNVPRIGGETMIHTSMFDRYVEIEAPIETLKNATPSEAETRIGANIAAMVEDGSTIQVGIGAAPEAALVALRGHRDLGVHTELLSDGLCDLMRRGVVNNSKKAIRPGRTVTGFVLGSRACYDWTDRNVDVEAYEVDFVNSPTVIALNPKVIAINSATQVDLTGQVCADSIGHRIVSGVGGQMDFMLGASHSKGGKAIIAVTSRCPKGTSRIVSALPAGSGVVTTRPNIGYVVTEYGVARMVGRSLHERAAALIAIAHPDDRARLEREWAETHGKHATAAAAAVTARARSRDAARFL